MSTELFGMSLGSWVILLIIIVWTILAIKSYFFGGLKRNKDKGFKVGSCCDTGDEDACGCGCAGCASECDEKSVRQNAVMPTFKADPSAEEDDTRAADAV